MDAIAYKCPHCGAPTEVTEDMIGDTISCPVETCKRPFELTAPRAAPVASRELADGEKPRGLEEDITLDAERDLMEIHPTMARSHPLWFLVCVIAIVVGAWGTLEVVRAGFDAQSSIAVTVGALGLICLFVWWLKVIHTTLRVTTDRTVVRRGIIAKRTSEVRHDDVRNMQVHQNVVERLFGVGDIAISSSGQDDLEIEVDDIAHPDKVADLVRTHQRR